MTATQILRKYEVSKTENGYFILTGKRGAAYVATAAYIGDNDTMKLVGGKWGCQILRDQSGRELHISRRVLEEFAA